MGLDKVVFSTMQSNEQWSTLQSGMMDVVVGLYFEGFCFARRSLCGGSMALWP